MKVRIGKLRRKVSVRKHGTQGFGGLGRPLPCHCGLHWSNKGPGQGKLQLRWRGIRVLNWPRFPGTINLAGFPQYPILIWSTPGRNAHLSNIKSFSILTTSMVTSICVEMTLAIIVRFVCVLERRDQHHTDSSGPFIKQQEGFGQLLFINPDCQVQ